MDVATGHDRDAADDSGQATSWLGHGDCAPRDRTLLLAPSAARPGARDPSRYCRMFQFPDSVRIIRLNAPHRAFIGDAAPAVGDVGTVLFINEDQCIQVESVDADGFMIWLAAFDRTELELLRRA
jgi:hypothetical protein